MNTTIELSLPKSVDVSDFEIRMIVAAKLYELGKLSSGQAAVVAGLSKRAFWNFQANIMFQFLAMMQWN